MESGRPRRKMGAVTVVASQVVLADVDFVDNVPSIINFHGRLLALVVVMLRHYLGYGSDGRGESGRRKVEFIHGAGVFLSSR
mmetsp:Transcript_12592/g.27323  ORF Transcript_12592/g.27323 Transcript_12592/m.27323 type:complete len:82 (+) Transcript_12592:505-750(+)